MISVIVNLMWRLHGGEVMPAGEPSHVGDLAEHHGGVDRTDAADARQSGAGTRTRRTDVEAAARVSRIRRSCIGERRRRAGR
jgi:hypothetical protein